MTYCSSLCIAYAQKNLITVAENKKTSPSLLAQLCKGVEDMYKNAQLIAKEKPLCKLLGDQYLYYINNRVNYHEALTFSKLRDEALANFNKKGDGYGICITYQGAVCQCLMANEKEVKKIKVPLPKDTLVLAKEQQNGSDMLEKNKVYRNPCPELENLPRALQKIMANPAIPPEYKDNVEDSRELDALIPKEVRQMIEQYKSKMMDFIAQNLNQYENEDTVTQFLNSLGLPSSLETVLSSSSISDSLWRNISEVQSRGGTMYLNNLMGGLQRMPGEIKNRIEQSENLLKNEEAEDQKLRAQYGTRWNRRQSSDLNGNYMNTLADYKVEKDSTIIIFRASGFSNKEYVPTPEELQRGYQAIMDIFGENLYFNEEVMKASIIKHRGNAEEAALYLTNPDNVKNLQKEMEEKKKGVEQKEDEIMCLEEDKIIILIDILSKYNDEEISNNIWQLFSFKCPFPSVKKSFISGNICL